MHEYGIAQELIAEIDRSVRANSGVRARHVVVTATPGALQEDSLRVAFDVAKRRTTAADAELTVEHVPLDAYCLGCGSAMQVNDGVEGRCPRCGGDTWKAANPPAISLRSVEVEVEV